MSLVNYHPGYGVQKPAIHRGLVPNVHTVAAGSYAADLSYGSGAAQVNTYSSVVVANTSSAAIRQSDNDVTFNVQITIDTSVAAPFVAAGGELRFVPTLVAPNSSFSWARALPVSDNSFGLPLITNVEFNVVDTAAGTVAPALAGVVVGVLQARLLYGGELALVAFNPATGLTTAITDTNITALFATPTTQLVLSVSGSYRGQSQPHP